MSQRTSTRNQQVALVIAQYRAYILNQSNTTSYNNRFQYINIVFQGGICAGMLYDPRILPCHHRFCRGCWIRTLDQHIIQTSV